MAQNTATINNQTPSDHIKSNGYCVISHSPSLYSLCSLYEEMQEQGTSSLAAASSLPSSSERSSSSALHAEVKEGIESDDEIRRVPEMMRSGEGTGRSASGGSAVGGPVQASTKRRGRSPGDKENKRLKRLLRNRVSAQQARERKKAYMSDLEGRVKELETKNAELQERLSTLQNENQMLRQVLTRYPSVCITIILIISLSFFLSFFLVIKPLCIY
ncbi:hypothetical protein ACJIZ3_001702 [Penstemon smallii]|uniref:Transcription factor HY5 n=1 Tax=Penstemon smallii TaxID=265156 RepID=A0ABD3U4C2_9LAMI